jgi:ZIP family zinc transporter
MGSLRILGWQTALALTLHHIPEGVAIYAASRIDIHRGILIAIGMGLHYTPEAVSVVIPLYLSSQSAMLSILCTVVVAGMSCPLGGALSYFLYLKQIDDLAAGLILSFTAGLLAYVTVHGLLFSACTLDAKNRVFSKAFFFGVILMALCNSIFEMLKEK